MSHPKGLKRFIILVKNLYFHGGDVMASPETFKKLVKINISAPWGHPVQPQFTKTLKSLSKIRLSGFSIGKKLQNLWKACKIIAFWSFWASKARNPKAYPYVLGSGRRKPVIPCKFQWFRIPWSGTPKWPETFKKLVKINDLGSDRDADGEKKFFFPCGPPKTS